VDKKFLDTRKLGALKFWGFIEEAGNKMKITDLGRQAVKHSGALRSEALLAVVREVAPYAALVERAAYRQDKAVTATDVAAHWHEHFKSTVSDSDQILNDQAICFFQIAQGADLGILTLGRKGLPTRFEFDTDAIRTFISREPNVETYHDILVDDWIDEEEQEAAEEPEAGSKLRDIVEPKQRDNRVFITHGADTRILEQVKEIVLFGKFEPVVAMEHETAAKPVPKKVMDDMRKCDAAVIHVSTEHALYDKDGDEVRRINENVLIEIGAAMALYGERFILLVEEGVSLPSNLQGLYECRYKGAELDMPATMKLLKAFNEF
jgi:predicted nucleotide-binding protein